MALPRFLEKKPCILCGKKKDYKVMYSWPKDVYDHDKIETNSWDGRQHIPLQIAKCSCGMMSAYPSFKESSLDLVYPEDLIHQELVHFDENNKKFNSLLNMITSVKKRGVLLDIGARYGVFPWLAKKKAGFDAIGIEYNAKSVEVGKKTFKKLFTGTVADAKKVLKKCNRTRANIIVMDDVLEHLVHPRRDLELMSKIQKKGDILVFRQMDTDSIGHKLFGRSWFYLQPAAHMYYFNVDTLTRLLAEFGYKPKRIFKMHPLKNIALTILWRAHYHLTKPFAPKDPNKPLYMLKRKRMYDDMFTMIAEKQ